MLPHSSKLYDIHFISSHLISSHLVSSRLVSSHHSFSTTVLDEPGLFRLSGVKNEVIALHNKFDQDVDDIDLSEFPIHVITGALKHHLREQTNPLVPFHLYNSFMDAYDKEESEELRLEKLCNCIDRLPPENKPIFGRLWVLLGAVVDHADKNKMTANHLGYIFSTILSH